MITKLLPCRGPVVMAGAVRFRFPLVAAAALFVISGCEGVAASRPSGESLTGTVAWEGKPLALGNISFIPNGNLDLPSNKGLITNGRYDFPNPPGVPAGSYKVRISSKLDPRHGSPVFVPRKGIPDFNPVDPAAPELVPEKYNDGTTLTAEVTAGANIKDFQLTGVRSGGRNRASAPRR
jgi:hypothetical protein